MCSAAAAARHGRGRVGQVAVVRRGGIVHAGCVVRVCGAGSVVRGAGGSGGVCVV